MAVAVRSIPDEALLKLNVRIFDDRVRAHVLAANAVTLGLPRAVAAPTPVALAMS